MSKNPDIINKLKKRNAQSALKDCLLYTSDAADD